MITLDNMLEYVQTEVQPDMIMWGGDSTSHDSNTQSFEETVNEMLAITEKV
jgi:hypothetical protein